MVPTAPTPEVPAMVTCGKYGATWPSVTLDGKPRLFWSNPKVSGTRLVWLSATEKWCTSTLEGLMVQVSPIAEPQPTIRLGVLTGDIGLPYTSGDEFVLEKWLPRPNTECLSE